MSSKQPIEFSDIAIIVKSLINLINDFPGLPPEIKESGVLFEQLVPDEISMCLSTIPTNSIVEQRTICGKYTGVYNFKIIFQNMSVTNEQRINAQDLLEKLASWLEKTPIENSAGGVDQLLSYPMLSQSREIISIKRNSFARITARYESNIENSEINMILKYSAV
jgi:hypothetical protein